MVNNVITASCLLWNACLCLTHTFHRVVCHLLIYMWFFILSECLSLSLLQIQVFQFVAQFWKGGWEIIPLCLQDLRSPARGWACALGSERESSPLDHQGVPWGSHFLLTLFWWIGILTFSVITLLSCVFMFFIARPLFHNSFLKGLPSPWWYIVLSHKAPHLGLFLGSIYTSCSFVWSCASSSANYSVLNLDL